eukprot:1932913-Rhodomonas_salina.1
MPGTALSYCPTSSHAHDVYSPGTEVGVLLPACVLTVCTALVLTWVCCYQLASTRCGQPTVDECNNDCGMLGQDRCGDTGAKLR